MAADTSMALGATTTPFFTSRRRDIHWPSNWVPSLLMEQVNTHGEVDYNKKCTFSVKLKPPGRMFDTTGVEQRGSEWMSSTLQPHDILN